MKITKHSLLQIIKEELQIVVEKKKKKQQKGKKRARKTAKRKKKKAKKRDACYHKVKSRYDVWPSAYASGALVKCRKVGAKNWGKSTTKEELELYEGKESLEAKIRNALIEEGGAAGMKALKDHTEASEKEIKKAIKGMKDVGLHEDGDYILQDKIQIHVKKTVDEDLGEWFGKSKSKDGKAGWVDVVDGDACAREEGETATPKCVSSAKRASMTPAERRTAQDRKRREDPNQPNKTGAAKPTNVKTDESKKKKNESFNIEAIIKEELQRAVFKPGLLHHVENRIPVTENIYRPGSPCFFNVIKQARHYHKKGLYEVLNDQERDLLENSELGEWAVFEGERVPLDFPLFVDEVLSEKKSKKKKDPPLNKPSRNTGSGKKYKVFVRDPKTGNIRKVSYGDAKGGLKGGWNSAEARKSFAARHNCAEKSKKPNKRLTAGYWACRAHKDFGPGIGRFW